MVTSVTPYQQSQHLSTTTAGGNYHHPNIGNLHRRSSASVVASRGADTDRDTSSLLHSQIPCKFFLNGYCLRGDQCHFSHEISPQFAVTLNSNTSPQNFNLGNRNPELEQLRSAAATMPGIIARNMHTIDPTMPLAWTLGPSMSGGLTRRNPSSAASDTEAKSFRQEHQIDSSLRAEASHASLPATTSETPTALLPGRMYGRQMSLQLTPESVRNNVHADTSCLPSAGLVHSVLGNGSHTSLLDADPNLLASLPTLADVKEPTNGKSSNKPSPSLSQRRMSVSHAADSSKGSGKSYAAAVTSSSAQARARQPETAEHAEMFAGGQSVAGAKNISIPNSRPAAIGSTSQSVPLLSSSGSFFDMLSSDQDTFNYTRQHMSSGESNGSLVAGNANALPTKSGSGGGSGVGLRSPSFSFNNRDEAEYAPHHQQQSALRRESLGSTTPLMDHRRHGQKAELNEVSTGDNGNNDASSSTWWSLPTVDSSTLHADSSFFDVNDNRTASSLSNADLPVSLDYCYNTFACATDDDDTMFSTATTNSFSMPYSYNNNGTIAYGYNDGNVYCANIPLSNVSSTDADPNGGVQVIRGEVFYGPPHLIPSQLAIYHGLQSGPDPAAATAAAALFQAHQFPALANNVAGDYLAESNEEWQRKRLEGRPEMFPHPASGSTMRRPPVCRAGLAGRCTDVECPYRHLHMCEWCNCEAINPDDPSEHVRACAASMEANMKLSFNVMSSQHRECGVCQEEIFENGRRFGILVNCKHIYCLGCIRNWRDRKQQGYDKDALRGCPECRIKSDFVVPSQYYVDDDVEKQRLIENYQQEMKKINCKYFNRGAGDCPFGDSCFYLHTDKRGQSITGLRPMFDSHTLLGCAFIEVEQGLTQRQRRQQQQRHRNQNSQSRDYGSSTTSSSTAATQSLEQQSESAEEGGIESGATDDVNSCTVNNNADSSEADDTKT